MRRHQLTPLAAHEFHEDVERVLHLKQAALNANVNALALDNAHAVAFHNGLGSSIYPSPSSPVQKYMNEEYIASYADVVYSKPNIAVVADGASASDISGWVSKFFKDVPATSQSGQSLKTDATKYYGGEQRISHQAGNSMVIAFPGSDAAGSKPEIAVLAALLGGKPTIKWAPGFSLLSKAAFGASGLSVSATNLAYSDAGLLTIQLSGNAASVRKAAEETGKALNNIANGTVSKDDITKAVSNAKFNILEQAQLRSASLLQTGSGLLHGGKVSDLAAIAKSIDGVNANKLKTVSIYSIILSNLADNFLTGLTPDHLHRLPRRCSMARLPFRPLVTCLCFHMLRRLACGCNAWFEEGKAEKLVPTVYSRLELVGEGLLAVFVNICSRNPFCFTQRCHL